MQSTHTLLKNNRNQFGRSTVEILGVLAIIGVLSIAAILGYSYGMDKYRANKIIQDISLRGVEMLARLENSEEFTEEDLARGWENETTIYPTSFFYEDDYDRFGVQVTGVPSRVCRFIGDSISDSIEIRIAVDAEEHKINEHTEECDISNDNTMYFFFEERQCFPECHSNEECIDGVCHGVQCTSDADCNQGYTTGTATNCARCAQDTGNCIASFGVEGKVCTFTDGTPGHCTQGTCTPDPEEGCTYDTNPCEPGFYCASPNASETEAFPDNTTGTCIEPRFNRFTITVNGVRQTWYKSRVPLSWWDATAACLTDNLAILSADQLVTNLGDATWTEKYGGITLASRTRTDLAKALTSGEYSDEVWTLSEMKGKVLSVNLSTDSENVNQVPKSDATYAKALCRDPNADEYVESTCDQETCECNNTDKPCPEGFYCPSSNTSKDTAFQPGETGTCKRPEFNAHVITAGGTTKTWYVSTTPLSYWDAKSVCEAAHLTMISASDLVDGWSSGLGNYNLNAQALALKELENISAWTENTNGDGGSPIFVTLNGAYSRNVEAWSGKNATSTDKTSFWALCKP